MKLNCMVIKATIEKVKLLCSCKNIIMRIFSFNTNKKGYYSNNNPPFYISKNCNYKPNIVSYFRGPPVPSAEVLLFVFKH